MTRMQSSKKARDSVKSAACPERALDKPRAENRSPETEHKPEAERPSRGMFSCWLDPCNLWLPSKKSYVTDVFTGRLF
jgi:hypothetical protein